MPYTWKNNVVFPIHYYVNAVSEMFTETVCHDGLDRYQSTEILDPLELNDDYSDKSTEYQDELDPDKNYFNQLEHHLSKSSNYYIDKKFK